MYKVVDYIRVKDDMSYFGLLIEGSKDVIYRADTQVVLMLKNGLDSVEGIHLDSDDSLVLEYNVPRLKWYAIGKTYSTVAYLGEISIERVIFKDLVNGYKFTLDADSWVADIFDIKDEEEQGDTYPYLLGYSIDEDLDAPLDSWVCTLSSQDTDPMTNVLLDEAISKFNNVEVDFYDMDYIKDYYSKF